MNEDEIKQYWKDRKLKVPDEIIKNRYKDRIVLNYYEIDGPMMVDKEYIKYDKDLKLSIPTGKNELSIIKFSTEWKFLIDSYISIVAAYLISFLINNIDLGTNYFKSSYRGQLSLSIMALTMSVTITILLLARFDRYEYQWKLLLVTGFFTFIISFCMLSRYNSILSFPFDSGYKDFIGGVRSIQKFFGYKPRFNFDYDLLRIIIAFISGVIGSFFFLPAHQTMKSLSQGYLAGIPLFSRIISYFNLYVSPIIILLLHMKFFKEAKFLDDYIDLTDQTNIRYICIILYLLYLIPIRHLVASHLEMAYPITQLILTQNAAKVERGNAIINKTKEIISKTFIILVTLTVHVGIQISLLSLSFWLTDYFFVINSLVMLVIGILSSFDRLIAYRI